MDSADVRIGAWLASSKRQGGSALWSTAGRQDNVDGEGNREPAKSVGATCASGCADRGYRRLQWFNSKSISRCRRRLRARFDSRFEKNRNLPAFLFAIRYHLHRRSTVYPSNRRVCKAPHRSLSGKIDCAHWVEHAHTVSRVF